MRLFPVHAGGSQVSVKIDILVDESNRAIAHTEVRPAGVVAAERHVVKEGSVIRVDRVGHVLRRCHERIGLTSAGPGTIPCGIASAVGPREFSEGECVTRAVGNASHFPGISPTENALQGPTTVAPRCIFSVGDSQGWIRPRGTHDAVIVRGVVCVPGIVRANFVTTWAKEHAEFAVWILDERTVDGRVKPSIEVESLVEIILFKIGKQEHVQRQALCNRGGSNRKLFLGVVVTMQCKAQLFQIVRAGHSVGRVSDFLDCREQKPDENGDDRNDHQEFDQREASAMGRRRHFPVPCRTEIEMTIKHLFRI